MSQLIRKGHGHPAGWRARTSSWSEHVTWTGVCPGLGTRWLNSATCHATTCKDCGRRLAVAIDFNASNGATLGVEWEIQLVDAETRHLRQDAREVLAALPSLSEDGDNPPVRHELMESTV